MTDTATEKPPKEPATESERLEDLFAQLNQGDTIKVYRLAVENGSESRSLKASLTDLTGVQDLEAHVFAIACKEHWPPSRYLAQLRGGQRGIRAQAYFNLEPPPAPEGEKPSGPLNMLEVARQTKELLGGSQPQASPDKVLESVTAAMKVGADAATAKAPTPDGTAAVLKPLIDAAVSRLMKEPAAAPDPWAFLERLEKMGLIGQKTDAEKPAPLVEQIGEIEHLADVLGRLRGPAGPAVEPTAVAVAKIFAPYVPQVLHTINNVVDVIRLRFGMPMTGQPGAPTAGPRQVGPPPVPPAVQQLVAQTQAAIAKDDDGFFPAFAEGIVAHILDGRNFLVAIQNGSVEEEQALLAVQGAGLLNAGEPRTRAWLLRFVHWLRVAKPMAAGPPSPAPSAGDPAGTPMAVTGRCERCQQEYRFDSLEEFQEDTRICDNKGEDGQVCAGNITRVAEGGPA